MFVLGIMRPKDLVAEEFYPMYILCRSRSPSKEKVEYMMWAYKTWLFEKYNSKNEPPKIVPVWFKDPDGHDELVDFMSRTRTSETHEFPKGILSWIFVNKDGEFTTIIPIRWTPSSYHRTELDGKELFEKHRERNKVTFQKLITEDDWCIDFPTDVEFGSGRPAVPTARNHPKKPKKEKNNE